MCGSTYAEAVSSELQEVLNSPDVVANLHKFLDCQKRLMTFQIQESTQQLIDLHLIACQVVLEGVNWICVPNLLADYDVLASILE